MFNSLLIIITLTLSISSHPLTKTDKITFPDDNSNDIIEPSKILKDKINTVNLTKYFNDTNQIESRFDEYIDDSVDSLKLKSRFLMDSDELLVSDDEYEYDGGVKENYENGEYFQGDMMITNEQENFFFGNENDDYEEDDEDDGFLPSRTGVVNKKFRWKKINGFAVIPYVIYGKSMYSDAEKTTIRMAMSDIERYTCIRFAPRQKERDFIVIYSGNYCSSFLGRAGGQQLVSLRKEGCFKRGIIIHELLHSVGYDHMQNSYDRDKFVKIVWRNIKSEARYNFKKINGRKFSNFGTDYDYYSIMHYDPVAFSSNGKRTVVPYDEKYRDVIGQRYALSKGDVLRVNNMYECNFHRHF